MLSRRYNITHMRLNVLLHVGNGRSRFNRLPTTRTVIVRKRNNCYYERRSVRQYE